MADRRVQKQTREAGEGFLEACNDFAGAPRCDHFHVHRAWVKLQRATGAGRCPDEIEREFAKVYADMEAAGPSLAMRQDVELLDLMASVNGWLAELD